MGRLRAAAPAAPAASEGETSVACADAALAAGWALLVVVLGVVCVMAFLAGLVHRAAVRAARLLPWHWRSDCPGRWKIPGRWFLRCDRCRAVHLWTSAAAERAAADNRRGGLLRFLAASGDVAADVPPYRVTRTPSPASLPVEVHHG